MRRLLFLFTFILIAFSNIIALPWCDCSGTRLNLRVQCYPYEHLEYKMWETECTCQDGYTYYLTNWSYSGTC